jgi:GGDEF domain-containing protein
MVLGLGPYCAAKSADVPAYAAAPIGRQVPIGAYIGVPLLDADGGLFGTLCAIDPTPQDNAIELEMPLVQLLARLLATILVADLKLSAESRMAEKLELNHLIDPASGVLSSVAWERVIAAEEKRCAKFGHPALVLCVKIRSQEQLRSAASAIQQIVPGEATVAHLGDGKLVVLLPECPTPTSQELTALVQGGLASVGIGATIEVGIRNPRSTLLRAVESVSCN